MNNIGGRKIIIKSRKTTQHCHLGRRSRGEGACTKGCGEPLEVRKGSSH